MKLSESALYLYCREGRYGAQIPTLALYAPGEVPEPDTDIVEIPDDWVVQTDSNMLPTTRRYGFLYWSRKGLRENEARLRAEFKTAENFRTGQRMDYKLSFADWLKLCTDGLDKMEYKTELKVKSLRKKLAIYETALFEMQEQQ